MLYRSVLQFTAATFDARIRTVDERKTRMGRSCYAFHLYAKTLKSSCLARIFLAASALLTLADHYPLLRALCVSAFLSDKFARNKCRLRCRFPELSRPRSSQRCSMHRRQRQQARRSGLPLPYLALKKLEEECYQAIPMSTWVDCDDTARRCARVIDAGAMTCGSSERDFQ